MNTQLSLLRKRLYRLFLSFGSNVKCPVCGWSGSSFFRYSIPQKPAPIFSCPACSSVERHRFAYFRLKDDLYGHAKKTLHFAPEPFIEKWLRSISKEYLSVDLMSPVAMKHMDITDLDLDDCAFSLIWCSHVLEHIEDDGKAMDELFRVLEPSGKLIIQVPIYGEKTYENDSIKTPIERLKHFKQEDHVRLYGTDISERLQNAGFMVDTVRVSDIEPESVYYHGLSYPSTNEIFICTRPELD